MTLVCAWLDKSSSTVRLSALADMRVTAKVKKAERVSDLAVKLFALPVRCHAPFLAPNTGCLGQPYFETHYGMAYAGRCLESLYVVEHLRRAFGSLIDYGDEAAKPVGAKIHDYVNQVMGGYVADHADVKLRTTDPEAFDKLNNWSMTIIVFGWDEDRPWISRNSWALKKPPVSEFEPATDTTFVAAGEDCTHTSARINSVRQLLDRRTNNLKADPASADPEFSLLVEAARMKEAERKEIEQAVEDKILAEASHSIGGPLQKIELESNGAWSITRNAGVYSIPGGANLGSSGDLQPLDLVQSMGRAGAPAKQQ